MLTLLLAGLTLLQSVLPVPKNDGWVTDLAHILETEQERALESLMESYEQGTTHEIALLTTAELKGEPIESFALRVAREWQIGSKETSNGALIVVAVAEHALRIEVGRGLEGALPDAICWRIIQQIITPQFKQGRYYDGLRGGIEAIHAAIGGDYAALRDAPRAPERDVLALVPLILFVIVMIAARASRRRGRGGRGPWFGGPWLGGGLGGLGGGLMRGGGFSGGGRGGGFGGFGGGGGFSGGGASGRW